MNTNEQQKSLGQIAHEAYLTRGVLLMVPWDKYPDVRLGFEKAASAVEAAVLSRLGGEWILLRDGDQQMGDEIFLRTSMTWVPAEHTNYPNSIPRRRRIQPSPTPEVHVATGSASQVFHKEHYDISCPSCGGVMGIGINHVCQPAFLTPEELRALCGGQDPHRPDKWQKEWLTGIRRPLIHSEQIEVGDQYLKDGEWYIHTGSDVLGKAVLSTNHQRTTRPLPQPPATPAGEDKPSMEQIEVGIDRLSTRCGFPIVLDRIQVLNTIGNRVEKLDRMLNEKIEQLQQVTRERDEAVADGKSWRRVSERLEDELGQAKARAESSEKRLTEVERKLSERTNILAFAQVREKQYQDSIKASADSVLSLEQKLKDAQAFQWIPKDQPLNDGLARVIWANLETQRLHHGEMQSPYPWVTHYIQAPALPTPREEDAFDAWYDQKFGQATGQLNKDAVRQAFEAGRQSK